MALDADKLKDNIQKAFEDLFPGAFSAAMRAAMPLDSKDGMEAADRFGKVATEQIAEPLAIQLSSAIDYYIRTAEITGQCQLLGVSTVGGPTSQAQVVPLPLRVSTLPTGMGGGKIPGVNEFILGIN